MARQAAWRLRPASMGDIDGLHALAARPLVFRYLFDGAPPVRDFIARRVAQSIANASEPGFGLWLLENHAGGCAGGVELRPYPASRPAELTYLLAPDYWGHGLAVRMAWTVIAGAFRSSAVDTVVAGADQPNAASFAVMRRLGMRFHKDVEYPLGAGAEYVLQRDDAGPMPRPALLPLG
ncbi:MAG TPA: GNAT family N-acetyltransferase [Acetobacteraceae bacterium]